MKTIKISFNLTFIFISILGCNESVIEGPEEYKSNIELRENLSESEFKEALIGYWENQFEHQGKKNVEILDINSNDSAKIIITLDNMQNEYSGVYSIDLLRPYEEGKITLAKLTLKTDNDVLILINLNFGLHNAFSVNEGYFLRIDDEPYGVMKRKNN